VWGIRATIALIKGADNAYNESVYVLLAGAVIGFMHIMISRSLRGASMPVDAVVYVTVLTLVIFLLFKIPAIWQGVDFTKAKASEGKKTGGAAAILLGLLTLTIQYTMGSTHTWGGVNYADAFQATMTLIGIGSISLGLRLLTRARVPLPRPVQQEPSLTV
jgi:Ca2+/Na+ antiporter